MMNDDFEQLLSRQKARPIPPEWRAEILQAAKSEPSVRPEPAVPWWQQLIWPSPAAWASVACAWVVTLALNVASRPGEPSLADSSPVITRSDLSAIAANRELLLELARLNPASHSKLPPIHSDPPGAFLGRKTEEQIA